MMKNWLEYHGSIPHMVPYPCVLNRPVVNLNACCDEIGLEPEGDPFPLFDILLQIAGENYCDDLMPWIHMHQNLLVGPRWWLGAHALSFDQYIDNMATGGQCDGLEVWLVSLVSGHSVNVVQDDLVWSTSQDGVDFTQATLVLTSYNSGVWCHQVQDSADEAQTEVTQELQISPGVKKTGGRLLTSCCSPGSQSPSSHTSLTETEPELLMDAPPKQIVLLASAGTVKERVCPVCDQPQYSGLALMWHLCSEHPDSQSYPVTLVVLLLTLPKI